jgi:GntR family transcriptional regulator
MASPQLTNESDSRLPRYHRLRETLAAAIASRQWGVGQAIPTEVELARKYDMSVGTVRKAIELLIADGLVDRIQGKGTYVRRPTFSSSLFRFFRTPGGTGIPATADGVILERSIKIPPRSAAEALQLETTSQAVQLRRLRSESGQPILYEEIWVPLVPFTRLLDFELSRFEPLLYPLYETEFGVVVTRAKEHLTIGEASREIADQLKIAEGGSVVIIERTAFDQPGRPVEWRRSVGAGARFHYQIDV